MFLDRGDLSHEETNIERDKIVGLIIHCLENLIIELIEKNILFLYQESLLTKNLTKPCYDFYEIIFQIHCLSNYNTVHIILFVLLGEWL